MKRQIHVRRRQSLMAEFMPNPPSVEELQNAWDHMTPEERRELDLLILADPAPKAGKAAADGKLTSYK
jgi:hypothetical protein